MAARSVDPDVLEDLAAEADERGRERVDLDVEGEDHGPARLREDERRRPAGGSERGRPAFAHEAAGHQLAGQPADGAPGQARPGDEPRAGRRAVGVQDANDRAQVRSTDRLAPEPGLVADGGHGGLCSSCSNFRADCTTGSFDGIALWRGPETATWGSAAALS